MRLNNKLLFISLILLGLTLCIIIGFTINKGLYNNSVVYPDDNEKADEIIKVLDVEEAIKNYPHVIELPSYIPFEVSGSYAQLSNINGNHKIEITYVNERTEQYLILRIIDMIPVTRGNILEETNLINNNKAQYLDNDRVQILYWNKEDLSYSIVASKGLLDIEKVEMTELVKVANSFN